MGAVHVPQSEDRIAAGPVDLGDARTLTLVVDYGRRADVRDHAVWLDPRLVK